MFISASGDRQPEGAVTDIRGDVRAEAISGGERKLKKGSPVYAGDLVKTDERSSATILLADKSTLDIKEYSTIQINDSLTNPEGHSSLSIIAGRMWAYVVGDDDKPGNLEVETPTTVVGVRGTGFWVAVSPDGTSRVGVGKGVVAAETPSGQARVEAGKQIDTGYGGPGPKENLKDGDRAFKKFDNQGLERLRKEPERVTSDMVNAMKGSLSRAQSARDNSRDAMQDYRTLRKEVEKRSLIIVSDEDKEKVRKGAVKVLSEARQSQKMANRSRANAELLRFAKKDADKNGDKYGGKAGAVEKAAKEADRLAPEKFQRELARDLTTIGDELERDIMRFNIAPRMDRVPQNKKTENIKKETGTDLDGGLPPPPGPENDGPEAPMHDDLDLPPVEPETEPEPSEPQEPEHDFHNHPY